MKIARSGAGPRPAHVEVVLEGVQLAAEGVALRA